MRLRNKLVKQLLAIALLTGFIIYFSIGVLLPKTLLPIYEKNIYHYLEQPLTLISNNIDDGNFSEEVAYLYVTNNNEIIYSNNLSSVINLKPQQILDKINGDYGKFKYLDKTYYYNTSQGQYVLKIALTNNDSINRIKLDIFSNLFPIVFLTLILISILMLLWSRNLIKKIEFLKEKIDNLNNDNYKDRCNYRTHDELKILSDAIDNMKENLKIQEDYKNQMYQSISHDFKTPITVMKSYIEAIEDGVETSEDAFSIIKDQLNKLEIKVHSLLYFNKLNYIKDANTFKDEKVDLEDLIYSSVNKFKLQRPEIKWQIDINKKGTFKGTYDMWETIIDNILNNFMRYADKEIKIVIRDKSIRFYNDGEHIDENILDDIFNQYKKGIKGEFGLGLSIVKKTVALFGYGITVKNEKKGVSFIIK